MNPKDRVFKVLSIDAWREAEGGWTWNNWYEVRSCEPLPEKILGNTRKMLNWLRKEGVLGDGSLGRVAIEDDQYNYVVIDRHSREPIYAVQYGDQY